VDGVGAVDGVDAVEVRVVAGVGVAAGAVDGVDAVEVRVVAGVGVAAGALLLVSSSPRRQEVR
jgi:hypothetical protein